MTTLTRRWTLISSAMFILIVGSWFTGDQLSGGRVSEFFALALLDASRASVDGKTYVVDWTAVAAIGTLLAVIVAVGLTLVQRNDTRVSAAARAEQERRDRLKEIEAQAIARILSVLDLTRDAVLDEIARGKRIRHMAALRLRREIQPSPDDFVSAQRAWRRCRTEIQNGLAIIGASRAERFPLSAEDRSFRFYRRSLENGVIGGLGFLASAFSHGGSDEETLKEFSGTLVEVEFARLLSGVMLARMWRQGSAREWAELDSDVIHRLREAAASPDRAPWPDDLKNGSERSLR